MPCCHLIWRKSASPSYHSSEYPWPVTLGPGVLGRIVQIAEAAGAVLQAIYPVGRDDAQKVIVRFHAPDMGAVISALEAAGFPVIESVEMQR